MQSMQFPTLFTLHLVFTPNTDRQFWLQKLWFINKCQKEERGFSYKLGKFYNDSVTKTVLIYALISYGMSNWS